MTKSIIKYLAILSGLMVLSFVLHLVVLGAADFYLISKQILGCYLFNYIIAIATYLGLILFKDKLSSSLGFVFMGGSMVKFGLFFLLFYPSFNQDGDISRIEFASFFIPYAISLIVEVVFLVKTLNN